MKRICAEAYKSADDGLVGNDDCGQMSAWYVFSALGIYPFNPCGGEYVIGAPQVPMAVIQLPQNQTIKQFKQSNNSNNQTISPSLLKDCPKIANM